MRIGVIGDNSIKMISIIIDIWREQNTAVIVDWHIPLVTSMKMLKDAQVTVCYIDECLLENECDNKDIQFIAYKNDTYVPKIVCSDVYQKFVANYSNTEAVVIYSSGTTGEAKGIILSHYAINTNADIIIKRLQLKPYDCLYLAKPLCHSSTITGELLVAIKCKLKLIVAPTVVPPRYVLQNIAKFSVTYLFTNPSLLSLYADEQLKKSYNLLWLKKIYVSGAILTDKIFLKATKAFRNIPIFNMYGLSEAGPRVSMQDEQFCSRNSVGKPLDGVQVKIVDDNGVNVKCYRKGYIYIKTSSLFSGYANSSKRVQPNLYEWFNTRDIGYFDEEGELYVLGRSDNMLIINSHKIYPFDIEKNILNHPSVLECVVIKDCMSELVCAYVQTGNDDLSYELKHLLAKKMANYEIPQRFISFDSLPKLTNGKYNYELIRKLVNNNGVY